MSAELKPTKVPRELPMLRPMQVVYLSPSPWLLAGIMGLVVAGRCAGTDTSLALDGPQRETLHRYARDTWKSFQAMARPGGLPADGLKRGEAGDWLPTKKTTPTDIAAYLWSTLAAEDLKIIGSSETEERIGRVLDNLRRLKRVHGF